MCIRPAAAKWELYESNWISEKCVKRNVALWNKDYSTGKMTFEEIGQWLYYWCQAADLDWTTRKVKNFYIGTTFGPVSILGTIFTVIVLYDAEFRHIWSYRYYMLIAMLDCLGVMPAVVATIFNASYGYDNTVSTVHRFLQERSWIISNAFWSASNVLMVALAFDRVCAFFVTRLSGKLSTQYYISALVFGLVDGFLRKFLQAPAKRNVWTEIKHRYEETDNIPYKDLKIYQYLLVYDSIMDMAIAILLCAGVVFVTVGLLRTGIRRRKVNRNCTEAEARDRRLCMLLISVTIPVVVAMALEALYRFLESTLLNDKTTRWHTSWIIDHTYTDALRLTLIDMHLLNFDIVSHCLNVFARSFNFVLYFTFHDRIKRKALEKLAQCCCPGFKIVPMSTLLVTGQATASSNMLTSDSVRVVASNWQEKSEQAKVSKI